MSRSPIVALMATAILSGLAGDQARAWLAWDRERLLTGELWRLFTGHLVHAGWIHTLENVFACAVLLLWPATAALRASVWWLAIVALALTISVGLLFPDWPPVYVGLSGVLHGLFAMALTACNGPVSARAALLAGLWAKVLYEQIFGALPGSSESIGIPVAVDAHLIGTLVGTMLGVGVRPESDPSSRLHRSR